MTLPISDSMVWQVGEKNMPQIIIPNVWVVIVSGAVIWFIGDTMKRHLNRQGRPSLLGRTLALFGFSAVCLGIYAGFWGPVKVGNTTLELFSFSHFLQQSHNKADSYVRANLVLSSEPATGWHGGSKSSLQYTVKNNGDRNVSCLILRFTTGAGTGKTIDLPLHGPFPARETVKAYISVPPTVDRSYFKNIPWVNASHIVGARF